MKQKPPKLFLVIDGQFDNIEHDPLLFLDGLPDTVKVHEHLVAIQILLLALNLKHEFIPGRYGTNNHTIILKDNPAQGENDFIH